VIGGGVWVGRDAVVVGIVAIVVLRRNSKTPICIYICIDRLRKVSR